ncbi:MAG: indoleacetamide hydrolase [Caulobacteraceae bacterium]
MADLLSLSAGEAAGAIAAGDISAEAYSAALLARAEETASLNAFITINPNLIEQARAVDAALARGEPLGPLAGVPLALKDNIDTADMATSAGTPALRGWRPSEDAPVVRRLRRAGALILGKANMQELALGITSNNAAFGPVRNPHDPALIAGGSSGGTAAAIAAGSVPAGMGSDTAGSIRIPASLCGVAGLRPSRGRYSQRGIVPLSHSRDTAGPMARTVEDLLLLDGVITGDDEAREVSLGDIRLGVPTTHFWDDLDSETGRVCRKALARLADAGIELVEVDVSEIAATVANIGRTLTLYECIPDLDAYLAAGGAGITAVEVIAAIASPDVAAGYALAAKGVVSAEQYAEVNTVLLPRLRSLYADLFPREGLTTLVFPATPLPARPIGQDATVELNGRQVDTRSGYLRNTEHGALAGVPGLVIPAGETSAGLPVGLEFDAAYADDRVLLTAGLAISRVLGGA